MNIRDNGDCETPSDLRDEAPSSLEKKDQDFHNNNFSKLPKSILSSPTDEACLPSFILSSGLNYVGLPT